jgi:Chromo (CHRromatin Organisation MOdifier) domain
VRWKGWPPEDATWEVEGNLVNSKEAIKDFYKSKGNQQLPGYSKYMGTSTPSRRRR